MRRLRRWWRLKILRAGRGNRDELGKMIAIAMAAPLLIWQLSGSPSGVGLGLFVIAESAAVIIGAWALWQMLQISSKAGDVYYRRFTRKFLSKEYRDS